MTPGETGALDPLWPVLETYADRERRRLTVHPELAEEGSEAVFVRPGERVFDRFVAYFYEQFARRALRGSTFVDPWAEEPYLFHLARIEVVRRAEPTIRSLDEEALLASRLVGLRQDAAGHVEEAPIDHLLLLRDGPGVYGPYLDLVAQATDLRDEARIQALEVIARPLAAEQRQAMEERMAERVDAVRRGYDYRAAQLSKRRSRHRDKARQGDAAAQAKYQEIKEQQRTLAARKEARLRALQREPTLIEPGDVTFLAHALVIPSSDPEDRSAYYQRLFPQDKELILSDRRLIEVDFPLEQTSLDAAHEKYVRHGHISTLHIWPARRPLAACRATLIATLLPDPGDQATRDELLERLGGRVNPDTGKTVGGVLHWKREKSPDLDWFRERIVEHYDDPPKVLDPFAGDSEERSLLESISNHVGDGDYRGQEQLF